jgi:YgiT-type zinc finger domain-containing protein
MRAIAKQKERVCSLCKIGKPKPADVQFSLERGHKIMLVGNVPGFECDTCFHEEIDKAVRDELTKKTCSVFAKSSCVMFVYEFSDLVRPVESVNSFELFDLVRIKDEVDTWDLYDEDLLPGMEGTVIESGTKPFDYAVKFLLDKRKGAFIVEIDEKDLELVGRVKETGSPANFPATTRRADDFGMFDGVKLKMSIYCDDIYGGEISLRKGKNGCVLELGEEPNTVIVEFKIGRGMKGTDYTAVQLDADCLEMVHKIGSRFSERNPYLDTAVAIKAGT